MSFSDRVLGFGAFPNRDTTYDIEQSLMFDYGDTAYLHRTPGSAGNRRTFTWSGWVKRASILGSSSSVIHYLFTAYDNSSASDATWLSLIHI